MACPHRDKTKVQMPARMFPHLKILCWLFMGPTLGVDTKQRNTFFDQYGVFLQLKQDSDNIILVENEKTHFNDEFLCCWGT